MHRLTGRLAVWLALLFAGILAHPGYLGIDQPLELSHLVALSVSPGPFRVGCYAGLFVTGLTLVRGLEPRRDLSKPALGWLGGLLFFAAISIVWSQDTVFSSLRYLGMTAYVGCALGLARAMDWEELRKLTAQSCGLLIWLAWILEVAEIVRSGQLPIRFSGPFHPNTLGGICATWLVASTPDLNKNRCRISWGISALTLVLTGSRACLLGYVVALAALAALTSLKRALGILLLLPLAFGISSGIRGSLWNLDTVLSARIELWEVLFSYIRERPLLGYGFEGFFIPERTVEVAGLAGWVAPSAHSLILELVLSLGFVGLVLFFGFTVCWASKLLRKPPATPSFVFSLVALGCTLSLVESTYLKPYSPYGLFTLTCILAIGAVDKAQESAQQST